MSTTKLDEILQALKLPFHPSDVYWKPGSVNKEGTKALALAYANLRAYQNRLDEICGADWNVTYLPWGERIICNLTISGVTRASTGEADSQQERSEIGGTSAEAQAFKRACSAFSLGRYLYHLPTVWVGYDAQARQFTDQAKTKLQGIVAQHYQRTLVCPSDTEATAANESEAVANEQLVQLWQQFDKLGSELYGDRWAEVSRHNTTRLTEGATDNPEALTAAQLQTLITGMEQLKGKRKPARNSQRRAKIAE